MPWLMGRTMETLRNNVLSRAILDEIIRYQSVERLGDYEWFQQQLDFIHQAQLEAQQPPQEPAYPYFFTEKDLVSLLNLVMFIEFR